MTSTPAGVARVRDAVTRRLRRIERAGHRRFLAVGDRVACPVCGWSGRSFLAAGRPRRPNRLCPSCLSSERDRAFDRWLRDERPPPGTRVLEIAPIGLVQRTARELGFSYTSLDLRSLRATVRGDLCRLPFPADAFDLVVCFHVLEHIPADRDAMADMARVLAPDGRAVVVVPWNRGREETLEDPDTPPEDRERLYGQSDHVRLYGVDVTDRLRHAGMDVEEVAWAERFGPADVTRMALAGHDDRFWICSRRSA